MALVARIGEGRFHFLHFVDAAANGLEIGQHAAQPALIDVELVGPLGFFFQNFGRLALRADEQDGVTGCHGVASEGIGLLHALDRLLKVDNVDAVAFPEQEPLHFGIPTVGLVSEMDAGFQ